MVRSWKRRKQRILLQASCRCGQGQGRGAQIYQGIADISCSPDRICTWKTATTFASKLSRLKREATRLHFCGDVHHIYRQNGGFFLRNPAEKEVVRRRLALAVEDCSKLLSLLLMFNQLLWIREIRPRSKRNKIHTIEFWISQKDTSRTIFNNLRRWLLWIYDYLIIIIIISNKIELLYVIITLKNLRNR